jgi:hypothetical protein
VQTTSTLNVGMDNMKIILAMAAGVLALGITECSTMSTKSPDVAYNIHKALTDAGLKDGSVKQDRDKGVVTLGGHVVAAADRARAESIEGYRQFRSAPIADPKHRRFRTERSSGSRRRASRVAGVLKPLTL